MSLLPRFSDLPAEPAPVTAAAYLRLAEYHPHHGHYLPLAVLEKLANEPNAADLETEVFTVLNERNAAVNEKYRRDR